jgi:uncharacterized protein
MNTDTYRLTQIWIYPIKSLGGIPLVSAKVLPKGLENDRRFMLIDSTCTAITQRDQPLMTLFKLTLDGSDLIVNFKGATIRIPVKPKQYLAPITVDIFDDKIQACEVSPEFSNWFSKHLGVDCKLMFFPEDNPRPVAAEYSLNEDNVSLADAYPILIIGEESLKDLNNRLSEKVPMNRFRPNLVFSGGNSFDEDKWKTFSIGAGEFVAVKPCARCVLTTINQETAEKGSEPLKTLASYRTKSNKVHFGQNLLITQPTEIKTGDPILIKSYR